MDSTMFDVTWLNVAKGNWRSMKSEILGNITSEVNGIDEVQAAVAKELKATRSGIPLPSAALNDYRNTCHLDGVAFLSE
jgi:hypothetical protein